MNGQQRLEYGWKIVDLRLQTALITGTQLDRVPEDG